MLIFVGDEIKTKAYVEAEVEPIDEWDVHIVPCYPFHGLVVHMEREDVDTLIVWCIVESEKLFALLHHL